MRHRNRHLLMRTTALAGALSVALLATQAGAQTATYDFDLAPQPLGQALREFYHASGEQIVFAEALVAGRRSPPVKGEYTSDQALTMLLAGTDLVAAKTSTGVIMVQAPQSEGAAGGGAEAGSVDALIVTAQKREENIQDVPIAISAFSQEDLTTRQVAGGPDLMTQVPNFTFTKTNFSSYSIQIRGIGTQAISATTDAAVAVAFNNTPFIRNRFFEQEFYDLQRIEVLRGPQGTLYGRNATAGVVNILSAKPSFQHEAKASGDISNYSSIRLEGMVNMPLVEDVVAVRLAGAWTKRDGYVTNQLTGQPIDGRDLWSTRLSLRVEPTENIRANLIWEHFEEDDDRLRSGKQLCKKDQPTEIAGIPIERTSGQALEAGSTFTQGCQPASMYSPDAYQTPNGFALPYYAPLAQIGLPVRPEIDPYVSETQSRDLRVIESTYDPSYRAKSDLGQLLFEIDLAPDLTLATETAYAADFVFSTQDFNRFATQRGALLPDGPATWHGRPGLATDEGFCDPQIGCTDRLTLVDLSTARSHHFSQELRLSSNFDGPFNFSVGANFLRYDTEDKYYVFANTLTLWAAHASWTGDIGIYGIFDDPYIPGVSDNRECLRDRRGGDPDEAQNITGCIYIDPNPIDSLNDQGHNYFLSRNPYRLISYAAFGETYYNIADNLKITAGLRWTVDKKRAPRIPSWLIVSQSAGYPVMEVVEQEWQEPTGRLAIDWKPDLGFTDETLLYASYARGYKAGGMNPPPAILAFYGEIAGVRDSLIQPKVFDAEFIDAFEVGAKNTLLDGRLTFNANAFYYDYRDYQLSQIINRSAVTANFDATVWGVEVEADWRPLENLRIGFKGGYENTRVADGESAIDLMDRTAGREDWVVMRPFPTIPSNCIAPLWLVTFGGRLNNPGSNGGWNALCATAYAQGFDPVTALPYVPNPTEAGPSSNLESQPGLWVDYPGFDPSTAPNNGQGFSKDLSGNELPNAPDFTSTITVDYTLPLPGEWLMTLHGDFYRQSEAWTRIFNMEGYDKLKAYTNVNLAAIFTNEDAGWHVMAYVKNVFDKDAITGAFLNSDDTGLTTNVFLLEPRLYGLRVTKQWTGGPWWGADGGDPARPRPFTLELGGQVQRHEAPNTPYEPVDAFEGPLSPAPAQDEDLDWGDGREVRLTYKRPDALWSVSLGARFGQTNGTANRFVEDIVNCIDLDVPKPCQYNYIQATVKDREEHVLTDFAVGRDVGFGALEKSQIGIGLRFARLDSESHTRIEGIPNYYRASPDNPLLVLMYPWHHHQYDAHRYAERRFEGAGPMVSWEASLKLLGDESVGRAALDWTVGGGVLFGRQKADLREEFEANYVYARHAPIALRRSFQTRDVTEDQFSRSASVTVPTVNLGLGLSYSVRNLKVGAGYRWERYFDAVDGGEHERRTYDRTIDGPYFKLSVGFGG